MLEIAEREALEANVVASVISFGRIDSSGSPFFKVKYTWQSIVNKYREGKVKRTPVRGVK